MLADPIVQVFGHAEALRGHDLGDQGVDLHTAHLPANAPVEAPARAGRLEVQRVDQGRLLEPESASFPQAEGEMPGDRARRVFDTEMRRDDHVELHERRVVDDAMGREEDLTPRPRSEVALLPEFVPRDLAPGARQRVEDLGREPRATRGQRGVLVGAARDDAHGPAVTAPHGSRAQRQCDDERVGRRGIAGDPGSHGSGRIDRLEERLHDVPLERRPAGVFRRSRAAPPAFRLLDSNRMRHDGTSRGGRDSACVVSPCDSAGEHRGKIRDPDGPGNGIA
jgi:hypothetical protein